MTLDEACAVLNEYYLYVRGSGKYDHEEMGVWEINGSVYIDTDWTQHKEDVILTDGKIEGIYIYNCGDAEEITFDDAEHNVSYCRDTGTRMWWNVYDIDFTVRFVKKTDVSKNANIRSFEKGNDKRIHLSQSIIN